MRTGNDGLRSIRRWLGYALPAPWDVQYTRTEDMVRPSGTITPVGPQLNTGSAYVRDVQRDFQAFLWPLGFEGSPAESRAEAEGWATTIERAMTQGLVVAGSRSMRIPAYDYEGVPWDQSLEQAMALDEQFPAVPVPYDFLVISNLSVEARPDPEQDDLFTVLMSLRASWRTDGDTTRFQGATLQDTSIAHQG